MTEPTDITALLQKAMDGDERSMGDVVARLYADLERQAEWQMRREFGHRAGAVTLEPAALVHETFLRLLQQRKGFANRGQFFAIATRIMMRVLMDYHRSRQADKRGGGQVRVYWSSDFCTSRLVSDLFILQ